MINSVDLVLLEAFVKGLIQFNSRFQVPAERFFDHDAGPSIPVFSLNGKTGLS